MVAITTRSGKGSALTAAEMDANLTNIKGAIEGQLLAGLADVVASSPANNQALLYNAATAKWIPGTVAGGGSAVLLTSDYGSITTIAANAADYGGLV
jgi:hypothetical protein